MLTENKRIEYISLASVLSSLAVIYLHANSCFWTFSTARYWFTANIIESVFYFAVPVFFMISGAMLIDFHKKYDLKTYFSKRINKTVIPYLIWSFIGLILLTFYFETINFSDINLIYILNGLFTGKLVSIYGFFIPLFCTYLSIPLFALIPEERRKDIFIYICAVSLILNFLIPFIISVFDLDINFKLSIAVGSGYLFYTLAGYLIHKYELKQKYRLIIYVLAIIGLLMHIIGTYESSMLAGEIVKTFKGYTKLPCLLYSVGIFVFIKYDLIKIMKINVIKRFVNFADYYTFGIYLVHIYILYFLIKIFSINNTSIIFRLFSPIVIYLICIAVIYIIRKIPFGKKIIP